MSCVFPAGIESTHVDTINTLNRSALPRIISNERPDTPGTWVGNVTDPRDGSTYGAKIWLEDGNLHLRGYIGIPLLGSTQVWHKFTGRLTAECGLA